MRRFVYRQAKLHHDHLAPRSLPDKTITIVVYRRRKKQNTRRQKRTLTAPSRQPPPPPLPAPHPIQGQVSRPLPPLLQQLRSPRPLRTLRAPEEKRSFFECFPYICPEPVLVKCSFLDVNGSKRPFLLTRISSCNKKWQRFAL